MYENKDSAIFQACDFMCYPFIIINAIVVRMSDYQLSIMQDSFPEFKIEYSPSNCLTSCKYSNNAAISTSLAFQPCPGPFFL